MGDFTALDRTATSQHGVLTFDQLKAGGFSKRQISYRLQQGILRQRSHGVYLLAGSQPTWEQDASAATLATRPFGALSHRSAARQWRFRTVDDDLDVVILHPRKLVLPGVHVHRSRDLLPGDITLANGIATTTPERTICDLGLIFPDHEVQRILDHAIATDLVTRADIERLRSRISQKGRDGAGTIRRCLGDLPDLAEQSESGAEVLFLRMCEQCDIEVPTLQLPVASEGRLFRVDFAYPAEKIFIEVDGKATHGGIYEQIASDDGRQNVLVAAGWRPIRFTYPQLKFSAEWCASVIRRTLASGAENAH